MEEQMKKPNHYIVIIITLILIILAFAYNQWGKKFLPEFKSSSGDKFSKINYEVTERDIRVGNKDAEVTIIEYYSYACEYCRSFHENIYPLIIEDYVTKGTVKFVFRPFPPYELGQAVSCADEQGKFLEYHNYLFDNIDNLKKAEDLSVFAGEVGLDESKFSECYNSGKYKTKAEDWYNRGMDDMTKAKIPQDQKGTPIFFINGEPLLGVQAYPKFIEVIENKLK
jgi:protein-disulfide isomerase